MAAVFLFAIWIDPSQPARAVNATYALLCVYVLHAVITTVITWDDWWLDAKLAAPAHVVDIVMFTLLVLASDGYTSPFFVFFVFIILSAAIRWGWRETALTAGPVTLLYVAAGFAAGSSPGVPFDLQRFIIRAGNLVVLSGILIWFGINKGFASLKFTLGFFLPSAAPNAAPMETAIEGAMQATGAKTGLLLWREDGNHSLLAICADASGIHARILPNSALKDAGRSFLFNVSKDRGFSRDSNRRMRFFNAREAMDADAAQGAGIDDGLAVPIHSSTGHGMLYLGGIDGLCTDHVDFGEQLSDALATHIQQQALVSAVDENATARARLSLARDLHDSIVQFLAGATFRIEAIRRAIHAGDQPDRELSELKSMMLEEQQELRSAIGALRASKISLPMLARDVRVLCERLARQWDIDCSFSAQVPDQSVSMRLHLDTHQLVREAIANAVRHARAKTVNVEMTAEGSELRLDIGNDGSSNERLKKGSPWSLRERVDEANGTLMLATRKTGSNLSITLPLKPEARP
jgi:signal transduction histidine kinase